VRVTVLVSPCVGPIFGHGSLPRLRSAAPETEDSGPACLGADRSISIRSAPNVHLRPVDCNSRVMRAPPGGASRHNSPAPTAGPVGRLTVLARLRSASACAAEAVRAYSTLSTKPTAARKVRVNACLHSVPLAAVCCNGHLAICSVFQLAAPGFMLSGRTFNPKVAGSIPARPIENCLQKGRFGCLETRGKTSLGQLSVVDPNPALPSGSEQLERIRAVTAHLKYQGRRSHRAPD